MFSSLGSISFTTPDIEHKVIRKGFFIEEMALAKEKGVLKAFLLLQLFFIPKFNRLVEHNICLNL